MPRNSEPVGTSSIAQLQTHGLKATFQRIAILEAIEHHGHLGVDAIYEEVREAYPTLSLATVYKNIITMQERGVLVEVPISGHKPQYEIRKHPHMHLVCRACGAVMDAPLDPTMLQRLEATAQQDGFVLEETQMSLYGLCGACQKARAS